MYFSPVMKLMFPGFGDDAVSGRELVTTIKVSDAEFCSYIIRVGIDLCSQFVWALNQSFLCKIRSPPSSLLSHNCVRPVVRLLGGPKQVHLAAERVGSPDCLSVCLSLSRRPQSVSLTDRPTDRPTVRPSVSLVIRRRIT